MVNSEQNWNLHVHKKKINWPYIYIICYTMTGQRATEFQVLGSLSWNLLVAMTTRYWVKIQFGAISILFFKFNNYSIISGNKNQKLQIHFLMYTRHKIM